MKTPLIKNSGAHTWSVLKVYKLSFNVNFTMEKIYRLLLSIRRGLHYESLFLWNKKKKYKT